MYSGRGGWPCPAVLSPRPRPTPFFPPPTRRRTALNTKNTPQPLFISSLVQPDKSKRQRAVKYRYPPTCLRRDFQCVTEGRSLRVFVVVAWHRRSADKQLAPRGNQRDGRGRAIISFVILAFALRQVAPSVRPPVHGDEVDLLAQQEELRSGGEERRGRRQGRGVGQADVVVTEGSFFRGRGDSCCRHQGGGGWGWVGVVTLRMSYVFHASSNCP